MAPRTVISVSSHVAAGAVGNRVIRWVLERRGFAVVDVPTVLLPFHPGHGPGTRIVPPDEAFAALIEEATRHALRAGVAGIITGYFASLAQIEATARMIDDVKRAAPGVPYLCDPVLGDAGRLYQSRAVAEAVRDTLLPRADMATPNLFEAEWLAGEPFASVEAAAGAAGRLGPSESIVTSAPSLLRGALGNLLVTGGAAVLAEHRAVPTAAKGTGDALAAFYLAERLGGRAPEAALAAATAETFGMVLRTAAEGAGDLVLAGPDGAAGPAPALRRIRLASTEGGLRQERKASKEADP